MQQYILILYSNITTGWIVFCMATDTYTVNVQNHDIIHLIANVHYTST